MQKNGATALDLSFDFPFFGLQHRRIWVSSFGMVMFESPRELGLPFGGVGRTHSAILVAAAEYNLDQPGAAVTTHATATELTVAWHAPLFGSKEFSDVAISLRADGSAAIQWERVVAPVCDPDGRR